MRIVSVVGARPNVIKIAPLIEEMQRHDGIEAVLVHTGQHYEDWMSAILFSELGIPAPDYNLGVGSGSHAWQTAQVMIALEPVIERLRPDLILVVGDVNSTMAAALVAAKLGIPLAHVEAGLRNFDRSMPEEINRVVTDALAAYLFATEPSAVENLRREGIAEEKIYLVGNVIIDTLVRHRERAQSLRMPARCGVQPGGYAVVTLHRPSNVDDADVLAGILRVLGTLQERLPVLFPVHPRTRARLAAFGLTERLHSLANLRLMEPQGYLEFVGLMAEARLVLTDSGGIQEETTVLGIPCLTLRESTERPVTCTHGTNQVVGTAPERVLEAIWRTLGGPFMDGRRPELWDGRAAERVIAILLRGRIGTGASAWR